MEKCWLIRTKNKQILGPVTKQKIIEFVNKGSLAPDDEVTSGNGYWISIKEKSLVEKYIHGDIPQGFNPISEAPNVLTANTNQPTENTGSLNPNTMPTSGHELDSLEIEDNSTPVVPVEDDLDYPDMGAPSDEAITPSNEDLEYPDMGIVEANPVAVSKPIVEPSTAPKSAPVQMNAHVENQEPGNDEEGKLPDGDDLEYPDMGDMSAPAQETFDPDATDPNFDLSSADITQDDIVFSEPPQVMEDVTPDIPPAVKEVSTKKKAKSSVSKKKASKKSTSSGKRKVSKPQRNDRYLFYVLVFLILAIASGAYYYFTNIINSDVVKFSNPLIQNVQAQSLYSGEIKKKTFLN